MASQLSSEVTKLSQKWDNNTGWPKRLEWIQIKGLRGWTGQRIDFNFPIVVIVGENGSGKSSILQAAASVYKSKDFQSGRYASEFFPDTVWDKSSAVELTYGVRNGDQSISGSLRKPTNRWRGNPERPERPVVYVDLARLQPVSARVGYQRIANLSKTETKATTFDDGRLSRLSAIIGRTYSRAKMAISDVDPNREVPVLAVDQTTYSGFHQGAGELTVTELIKRDFPKGALVLIDEIETSLHPRVQRRIIRDFANLARLNDLQIIITTHSPYVLEELPNRARILIKKDGLEKSVLIGVSPEFAMTQMDDQTYAKCDIYVEDARAKTLIEEVIASRNMSILDEVQILACGPASVGKALGQMIEGKRFAKPTLVFLDGDQDNAAGCQIICGNAAPERVVFEGLVANNFCDLPDRLSRDYAAVSSSINKALTIPEHHAWLASVSNDLKVPSDTIWQIMSSEWAKRVISDTDANRVMEPIVDALS